MLKAQKYQEIFREKNRQKAIQLAKKFFQLDSTPMFVQNTVRASRRQSYYLSQTKSNLLKKSNKKFTAGFTQKPERVTQRNRFSDNQSQLLNFEKSKQQKGENLKKITRDNMNQILLGTQSKAVRKVQNSTYQLPQIIMTKPEFLHVNKTSSAPKSSHHKYDEIMKSIKKIKQQGKKIKLMNLPGLRQTTSTQNSQKQSIRSSQDKNAFKRHSISDKDRLQIYKQSTSITLQAQNALLQKRKPAKTSLKSLSPPKLFQRGYLSYDQNALKIWNICSKNTQENPVLTKKSIPGVTAKIFLVLNSQNLCPVIQNQSSQKVQIASLTKVMTCYLCILICTKYEVDMKEFIIRVSDKAAEMPGTSAQLRGGDLVTLYDLLYGLMLPSGNDASVAIAENVGKIIQKYKNKGFEKTGYETFIAHMNYFSKQLGLNQEFQNSSGLAMCPNFSTANSISVFSALAMKNSLFSKIVSTKQHQVQIRNQRFGLLRKVTWRNTNKLLWKNEWQGIKTGTTQTAGHCLISKKNEFIICVLACETLQKRFSESNKIYQFVVKQSQRVQKQVETLNQSSHSVLKD